MLVELRVQNFVLIEHLELRLERGFNALTGETGAGKSIVIGALGLVLGGRAAPDLVRPGAAEAEVEALFDVSRAPGARERVALAGVDAGDEVVLRRVVQASGRSRAYLNGRLCTATQLSELAPDLVDISSQHQSVALTDPATHLGYLDAFAKLEPDCVRLSAIVDELVAKSKEVAELEKIERTRGERDAFLRFQLTAIDEVDPRAGEPAELEAERTRLRHADRLARATRDAADRLYDKDSSLCDELARLGGELAQARELDATLAPLCESVEAARSALADAARSLGRYAEGIEANPERLTEIDERLFQLNRLMRQHGSDVASVLVGGRPVIPHPQQVDLGLDVERQPLGDDDRVTSRDLLPASAGDHGHRSGEGDRVQGAVRLEQPGVSRREVQIEPGLPRAGARPTWPGRPRPRSDRRPDTTRSRGASWVRSGVLSTSRAPRISGARARPKGRAAPERGVGRGGGRGRRCVPFAPNRGPSRVESPGEWDMMGRSAASGLRLGRAAGVDFAHRSASRENPR